MAKPSLLSALGVLFGAIAVFYYNKSSLDTYPEGYENSLSNVVSGLRIFRENKDQLHEVFDRLLKHSLSEGSSGYFKGKKILLTGASRGLGKSLATALHLLGADLVLPVRSRANELETLIRESAVSLAEQYEHSLPNEFKPKIFILGLDLSSMNSIDSCFDRIYDEHGAHAIDILINNAGLQTPALEYTAEGFEMIFGVNFVGTVYFTQRLLSSNILKSDGMIMNVGSESHRESKPLYSPDNDRFGVPWGSGIGDSLARYAYSKLALTTWTMELRRKNENLKIFDVCPGPVASEITRGVFIISAILDFLFSYIFLSCDEATLPLIHILISENRSLSEHYHLVQPRSPRSDAIDEAIGKRVWEDVTRLTKDRKPPIPTF